MLPLGCEKLMPNSEAWKDSRAAHCSAYKNFLDRGQSELIIPFLTGDGRLLEIVGNFLGCDEGHSVVLQLGLAYGEDI